MKHTHMIGLVVVFALLTLILASCASQPAAPPTIDIGATVDAQVKATMAANKPITPATPIPVPTVDVGATVQAAVQLTVQAQPTPVLRPMDTPTQAPPATAIPEETPTETLPAPGATPAAGPASKIPIGKWMVRTYNTDDAGAIWVNGQLVGVSSYRNDSEWININDYLLPVQDNIVAFASYNGASGGSWAFSIRRDDVSVWGVEQGTGDDWSLAYAQQVAIHSDGTVAPLATDTSVRKPPPGKWFVRAQFLQDIGSILVNGQPVAAFWNDRADWIDITGLLDSTRNSTVTFAVWNSDGSYSWDFGIKHDDTIVWGKQNAGSGATNQVYHEVVTISPDGKVVEAQPTGSTSDYAWSLRSYNTDDAGVIWVNQQLVGASSYRNDSDWIDISDKLLPGQENSIAFASYNGNAGGSWAFALRRDDIAVWGVEQTTGDDWSLAYAQQIALRPDGSATVLAPDTSVRKPPPGKWYIRAQNIQDIGGVLVNGKPVAAFWNEPADWIDITGLLDSAQDNVLTFSAWNFDGQYSWDFAIKHDEDIPWAVSNSGSGQGGVVLQQDVTITADGRVRQTSP